MVQDKGKGKTAASSSAPAHEIVGEFADSSPEEYVAKTSENPGPRPTKRVCRMGEQVKVVFRKGWKKGMPRRNFKNERQVKLKSIGTPTVWLFDALERNTARITSKVGNKDIMVDPSVIVQYMGYERPSPETGAFRDDIRVLNKAFHYNLYPRGLEHKPSQRSGELIYAFMNTKLVVDWAKFIFNQWVDFKNNTITSAQIPFPCMVTALCKEQGVKSLIYDKKERLEPGAISGAFLKKSKPRSSAPRERSMAFLTTKLGLKEKKDNWISKIFYQGVALLFGWKKAKKERRMLMRR
ncbi:hypothetical protein RHSIM_Rhsim11G0004200 [Rhododendron simsii]|uniref:Transposase n=1 Tax=Rhododendron simsii TaxID=118357 RepID=A0A834G8H2_RHOSS|nr:hypothetical protein RHSIM_Rhsim11G0004200 [Rhododendron simsii]